MLAAFGLATAIALYVGVIRWRRYRGDGFEIRHPGGCHVRVDGGTVDISQPENASGSVTISVFRGVDWDAEFLSKALGETFPDATVTAPAVEERRGDVLITTMELSAEDEHGKRIWLVRVLRRPGLAMLATANDLAVKMPNRRSTYLRVLRSIQLTS